MAGARAIALGLQFDLQLADFRPASKIVVAHEPVEIERRGRADIGIDRHHLRHGLDPIGGFDQRAFGIFQGRAFRQIGHDLQLGLVVERQQLHRHGLGDKQHAGRNGRDADAREEPALPAFGSG